VNAATGDEDRFRRFHRAGVFAGAAADAETLVERGQAEIVAEGFGGDCLGWAMFGTGGAVGAVDFDDAARLMKIGDADLCDLLRCEIGQAERIVRANFDAARAFEETKGRGVIESWLQQAFDSVFEQRRLQHVRRAGTDAEMTRGAAVEKLILAL